MRLYQGDRGIIDGRKLTQFATLRGDLDSGVLIDRRYFDVGQTIVPNCAVSSDGGSSAYDRVTSHHDISLCQLTGLKSEWPRPLQK
jgi:hypothetical protein